MVVAGAVVPALAAVVAGLFIGPPLMLLGGILLMVIPVLVLVATPLPRPGTDDYVADAYMRILPGGRPRQ